MTPLLWMPVSSAQILPWSSAWTYAMFGGLLLMIIMGTWTGAVAAGKGRSMQSWFIVGFFLPVVGLIIVYLAKPRPQESKQ